MNRNRDNDRNTSFTLGHSPDPDDAFMFYAMAREKNRSARVPVRASTGRYSDVERTRASRRAAHFRDLDPCLCVRRKQIRSAALRSEHGGRLRTNRYYENAQRPTLNVELHEIQ